MATAPPNVLGCPKPMSSISTMTTFGAPLGAVTSKRGGAFALRASSSLIGGYFGSLTGSTVRSSAAPSLEAAAAPLGCCPRAGPAASPAATSRTAAALLMARSPLPRCGSFVWMAGVCPLEDVSLRLPPKPAWMPSVLFPLRRWSAAITCVYRGPSLSRSVFERLSGLWVTSNATVTKSARDHTRIAACWGADIGLSRSADVHPHDSPREDLSSGGGPWLLATAEKCRPATASNHPAPPDGLAGLSRRTHGYDRIPGTRWRAALSIMISGNPSIFASRPYSRARRSFTTRNRRRPRATRRRRASTAAVATPLRAPASPRAYGV